MPHPGASLTNLLLLLDLPARPTVGQAGLDGSPFLRALARLTDRLVNLDHPPEHPGERMLDIVITQGKSHPWIWEVIRPGGWLLEVGDRRRGMGFGTSVPAELVAEERRWLLGPDLGLPHSIVPCTRRALRTHELATREPGWKRGLRLAVIARGWHPNDFGGEARALRRR